MARRRLRPRRQRRSPPPPPPPAETKASCEVFVERFTTLQADAILGEVPVEKQATWKARIGEVVLVSCRDDRWPQPVLTCAAAASTSAALDECTEGLGKPEQELLVERLSPLVQAMMDDVGDEAPPPPPPRASDPAAAAWTSGTTSVAACDAYVATLEVFLACDKVPPQAGDASRQAIAVMKDAWAQLRDPKVPAEARQAAADACLAGADALRDSAVQLGCPAPAAAPPPAPARAKKPKK